MHLLTSILAPSLEDVLKWFIFRIALSMSLPLLSQEANTGKCLVYIHKVLLSSVHG